VHAKDLINRLKRGLASLRITAQDGLHVFYKVFAWSKYPLTLSMLRTRIEEKPAA
jgi:hypothetical protein